MHRLSICRLFLLFGTLSSVFRTLLFYWEVQDNPSSWSTDLDVLSWSLEDVTTTNQTNPPHMVQYKGDQDWSPPWVGSTHERLESLLHKDQEPIEFLDRSFSNNTQQTDGNQSHLPMLAFVRIPKSSSTSILSWMGSGRRNPHNDCILGPMDRRDDFPTSFQQDYLSCPHRQYENMLFHWANSQVPEIQKQSTHHDASRTYSLQFFTILRDPFDRLVSHFYYVRRIYPAWSWISTPEQNATIRANNISGWMEQLHRQGGKAFHLPYQKGALTASNFSTATRMIQGASPRIYTVIQECFEASLWLLTERFPDFFSVETTAAFLNSSDTQHNRRSSFQNGPNQHLRDRAEEWFAADFGFYASAVEDFQQRLLASNVNHSIVQECLQNLHKHM